MNALGLDSFQTELLAQCAISFPPLKQQKRELIMDKLKTFNLIWNKGIAMPLLKLLAFDRKCYNQNIRKNNLAHIS